MENDPPDVVSNPASNGRRSFFKRLLQLLTGLWGAGFVVGAISYLKSPHGPRTAVEGAVEVGPLNELTPGNSRLVTDPQCPFWVMRATNGKIIALPAVCTHRRCILQWDGENQQLLCPCHHGVFDWNGNVLSGLPPRSLEPLSVTVKGGNIYVYL